MALGKALAILCGIALVSALPAEESRSQSRNAVGADSDLMESIYTDCLRKDSVSCVKYKLFSFVDKMLDQKDQFALTEGVTVIKTEKSAEGGAPRALSGDESIESLLFSRLQNFLQSHTVKVELKGADVINAVSSTGRALEDVSDSMFGSDDSANEVNEARGKKKKAAKIIGPLLLAVGLKAAALLPLVLGGIALIAGKALLVGKIALVLSAIIGLKKLLSQEKHVTYEVVAHPHHSSSHSASHGEAYSVGASNIDVSGYAGAAGTGHGGWGRSVDAIDAQDLAYRGQKTE